MHRGLSVLAAKVLRCTPTLPSDARSVELMVIVSIPMAEDVDCRTCMEHADPCHVPRLISILDVRPEFLRFWKLKVPGCAHCKDGEPRALGVASSFLGRAALHLFLIFCFFFLHFWDIPINNEVIRARWLFHLSKKRVSPNPQGFVSGHASNIHTASIYAASAPP